MTPKELAQWLENVFDNFTDGKRTSNEVWLLTARQLQKKMIDIEAVKNIIDSMESLRNSEGDTVAYEGLRNNLLVKIGLIKSHIKGEDK